ncbi:DUF6970 domain-containing protein [Hymenobacter arizonensis]|uniref:DUF6970 domain-containing protein n=1 Tax=Hymenobacter arizonensis TaxID=1227077 RepID=A0A1I5X9J1_HYMAR|nr:hypothetical protein [Hymenobacter arizonensis]SFQ28638.1 hypothetical protein SAMN04515668_1722 [Hymenobacter arizonensis]
MNKLLALAISALLVASCAPKQVSVTTPNTPQNQQVNSPTTPTPTGGSAVVPTPLSTSAREAISDTSARPGWLKNRISAVLAERKRNPIIRILSYDYRGQTVYYQSAPCCDQYSQVFDSQGRLLCQPEGGITGKGDGKCPDFDKNKANEKLVWQDPR